MGKYLAKLFNVTHDVMVYFLMLTNTDFPAQNFANIVITSQAANNSICGCIHLFRN